MSDIVKFFDLRIPAARRLQMMREAFANHPARYPHCPESVKPRDWRSIRGTTHRGLRAYVGALSAGFNANFRGRPVPVWYCHTGEQFRGEREAGDISSSRNSGYFTDSDCSEVARGIVGRLTHGRFIAGYYWSSNGERVYFGEVFDDEREAARAADSHAERFAESAREDSERFDRMQECERKVENAEVQLADWRALRRAGRRNTADVLECTEQLREAREALADATRDYEGA